MKSKDKEDKVKIIVQKDNFGDRTKKVLVTSITILNLLVLGSFISLALGYSNYFDIITYNIAKASVNDDIVQHVAGYCQNKDDDMEKIYCVNSFVKDVFIYNESKELVLPDELVERGGDCKHWTNFYRAVFMELNIKTEQVFLDTHTFLIAYNDEYYCNLDQMIVNCEVALE